MSLWNNSLDPWRGLKEHQAKVFTVFVEEMNSCKMVFGIAQDWSSVGLCHILHTKLLTTELQWFPCTVTRCHFPICYVRWLSTLMWKKHPEQTLLNWRVHFRGCLERRQKLLVASLPFLSCCYYWISEDNFPTILIEWCTLRSGEGSVIWNGLENGFLIFPI